MSRMSNIDLTIREILRKIQENKIEIILIFTMIVITVCACVQVCKTGQAEEERINNIETRLENQENYMHILQADIKNEREVEIRK